MSKRTVIASAGNVLPAALAALRTLGYVVTRTSDERLCKAENENLTLVAEDPLLLLGLAKLHEVRGERLLPIDIEVDAFLSFDGPQDEARPVERVDVWEEQGAVHMLCVNPFGDPVELGEVEAKEFAVKLHQAIAEASQNDG